MTWANRAAGGALGFAVLLLAVFGAGRLAGLEPLVERSGSMAPAIATGDLLLVHSVPADDIRRGDVVSFADALHPGVPTTHRVVALGGTGERLLVTTRGDANQTAEQWRAPRSGRIARVAQRLPRAGYAVAALGGRWVRLALLFAAVTGLATLALRRIWRTA
jgi:signal peptidase I